MKLQENRLVIIDQFSRDGNRHPLDFGSAQQNIFPIHRLSRFIWIGYYCKQTICIAALMTSRTFTVFQDVPADEVIKAKQPTSNGMTTRSSSGSDSKLSSSPASNEHIPMDKENVNPLTGERAGTVAVSKKRKTTVLADKSSAHLALKTAKGAQLPKKRKASSKGKQSKEVNKEGKAIGSTRKTTRRGAHKVFKLPRLEEEIISQSQETEHFTQASIDSRCYDLMVQPLADVSQAYEAIESAIDILASPVSKANFRKVKPSFMCLTLLTSHFRTRH